MIPNVQVTEASSTTGAAKEAAGLTSRYDVAICARVAGRFCGPEELAYSIEDNPGAVTWFVVVFRPGRIPKRIGVDKTTLVTCMHQDHLGALLKALQQSAVREVSLCRIKSRSTKTILGSYCSAIGAEGHLDDRRLAEILLGPRRICRDVIFLGSYPYADAQPADVYRGFDDEAFEEASEWLRSLDAG